MPRAYNSHILSLKEEAFVQAYLEHKNATKAARIAYSGSKVRDSDSVRGFHLLRREKVRSAIREGFRAKLKASGLTKEWLIARALTIAQGSLRHFLTRQGGDLVMKHSDQIPDDALDALQSIKVTRETTTRRMEGEVEIEVTEKVTEVKLHPAGPELDKLFKHFGLYFDASDLKLLREELDRMKSEIMRAAPRNGNGRIHAQS